MNIFRNLLRGLLLCMGLMQTTHAVVGATYGTVKTLSGPGSLGLKPGTGSAGDLLVAQIIAKSDATITAPAGWTKITAASTSQNGIQQQIYYNNTWDGDESSVESFSVAGTAAGRSSNGIIYTLSGVNLSNPVCGVGLQAAGGGNQVVAPNIQSQPPTCPTGSLRGAFFAINDGSINVTLALQNGAVAGPSNRAGSGSTGVGLFSSGFMLSSASNGGSQTGSLSNNAASIGSSIIFYAGAASGIDHIQLEITGTPLTCTPSTMTVKACTNASCTTLSASSTTVTLSAANGTLGNTSLTFTGSKTTTLRRTTVGTVTLDATSTPAEASATVCTVNGAAVAGCNVPFADSGLLLTIPPQVAGVTSNANPDASTFSVRAVKAGSTAASACVPAFASVARTVKFWSSYASPATGTKTLAVNGSTVATTSAGTNLSLSFDATGTASGLTLNYADAGQLTLNAQYNGSAGTNDTSLVMAGSAAFVTIPYAMCVDSPDVSWNCSASSAAAQTAGNCGAFTSAGTPFSLRVTAKAYQAGAATCTALPATPNYVQTGIALTQALFAPTSSGVNGSLSATSINIASGGAATTSQTESEVGVFTITATPPAYFGQAVPAGSANFGRFTPAGFALSNIALNNRSDVSCSTSSFTYLGEPLASSFKLTALNAGGTVTQNYEGSFARLNLATVAASGSNGLAFGAQNGTTLLNGRLVSTCASCGAFVNGAATVAASLTIKRAAGAALDSPLTNTAFGLVATDADGVGMRNPTYNFDLAGAADGANLGSKDLLFGRLRVDNAYGSSLTTLPVALYAQYWTGTNFAPNTADSCSRITVPASVSMSSTPTATLYCNGGVGLYGSLTGVAATIGGVTAGNAATLSNGSATISLSKPTNSGGGYLDLAVSVPDYLKYNVDGIDQLPDCSATADGYRHDDNPRARIRFGARTNDKVLYLREVY